MGDYNNKSHPQNSSSRLGLRNNTSTTTSGEIVEVPGGGHIVRSLGRKDRHSKVCTAKGPRDRRVRLAAHTAIQFYDVQDRLGYDRPSKAVDWLITKAKAAIDELAQLPPWHPTGCNNGADHHEHGEEQGGKKILEDGNEQAEQVMLGTGQEQQVNRNDHNNVQDSSFFTPQLDSDAIADTIKSFFPTGASSAHESTSSAGNNMQFSNFSTHHHDFISRTGGQNQDLNLSLQSFQDPVLMHNHHHHHHQNQSSHHSTTQQQINSQAQVLLSGTPLVGFVNGNNNMAWSDHQNDKFQSWNNVSSGDLFGSQPMLQQLLGQNQFLHTTTQRGPLQSSNYTPSIRAWMDQTDIHHHQQQGLLMPVYYPSSSVSGIGFASGMNGFTGFHVPARIQGNGEERNDGYSDKPSSASSDSHH